MDAETVEMFRTFRRNQRLAVKHLHRCADFIRDGRQEDALLEAMRAVARSRVADRASQRVQRTIKTGDTK